MSKRILSVLGSKHLYGKERSNIEVYSLLQGHKNVELKVLFNSKASDPLKNYLHRFDTISHGFPDRSASRYKYIKYLWVFLRLNLKILFLLIKFRPHFIFLNDERVFYDISLSVFFARGKVVYRIGDAPAFPKLKNYKLNAWIWRNIVLKKTHTFVYISEFIRNCVETTGRKNDNDLVIYNYPPHRRDSQEPPMTAYDHGLDMAVGYLGQIIPKKGVHLFVEAAIELLKERNELIFLIAGDLDYSEGYTKKLMEKVKKENLENRIVFLGSIDDVERFFGAIDVLVTPSIKQEPLGNVIVEAKKYATPSIIFPSGGMPELIAHKKNGFVCESPTASEIVRGIETYLSDPGAIKRHGQNAKASIKDLKIDYSNFRTKWLQVFGLAE